MEAEGGVESGEKGRKLNAVMERDDAIMYIALEATTNIKYKQKQFSFYISFFGGEEMMPMSLLMSKGLGSTSSQPAVTKRSTSSLMA